MLGEKEFSTPRGASFQRKRLSGRRFPESTINQQFRPTRRLYTTERLQHGGTRSDDSRYQIFVDAIYNHVGRALTR